MVNKSVDGATDRHVLTVYFSDVEDRLSDCSLNTAVLAALSDASEGLNAGDQSVLKFDGYGAASGLRGFLGLHFGLGMSAQCQAVVTEVDTLLKRGKSLAVNCYGVGRGAVTALMLARRLGAVPKKWLNVNLLLVDPVPGNALLSVSLDVFGVTQTTQAIHLRDCKNLSRVLTLYAARPSSGYKDVPMFPDYPFETRIEEDVIPGGHASVNRYNDSDGRLTFNRTLLALQACGTRFRNGAALHGKIFSVDLDTDQLNAKLEEEYEGFIGAVLSECKPRFGHVAGRNVHIVSHPDGVCLNHHHQALLGDCSGKRAFETRQSSRLNSVARSVLKWLTIGALLATALSVVGVLSMSPILAQMTAVLAVMMLTPVLAVCSLLLWKGVVSPLCQLVGKCLSPRQYRFDAPAAVVVVQETYHQFNTIGLVGNGHTLENGVPTPECVIAIDSNPEIPEQGLNVRAMSRSP